MLHKFHIFPTSTTSPHISFLHPIILTCGEQYIPGEWTLTFITFSIRYMTTCKCTLVRKRLCTEGAPTSSSYAARAARTRVRWCNCSNMLSRALSRYDFACRQLRRREPTLYSYMIPNMVQCNSLQNEWRQKTNMHALILGVTHVFLKRPRPPLGTARRQYTGTSLSNSYDVAVNICILTLIHTTGSYWRIPNYFLCGHEQSQLKIPTPFPWRNVKTAASMSTYKYVQQAQKFAIYIYIY
jgi:hypothetical protein